MTPETVTEPRARDVLRQARHEFEALFAGAPPLAQAGGVELADQIGEEVRSLQATWQTFRSRE